MYTWTSSTCRRCPTSRAGAICSSPSTGPRGGCTFESTAISPRPAVPTSCDASSASRRWRSNPFGRTTAVSSPIASPRPAKTPRDGTHSILSAMLMASVIACVRLAIRKPTAWSSASTAASPTSWRKPASLAQPSSTPRSRSICARTTTTFLSAPSSTKHLSRRSRSGKKTSPIYLLKAFMNGRNLTSSSCAPNKQ